jgi:threonylcarbamoyladenosine tRNA methylthiotransferase MtaB
MPTAAFFTLGCRLNQTESAIMAKGLENAGYLIISDQNEADLCVINTCTVTNQSNAKCRKKIRSIQKKNPRAMIAVVGCFSQIDSKQILEIGGIHLVLGNSEKLKLHEYLDEARSSDEPVVHVSKLSRDPFIIDTIGQYLDSTRANLKVQDGCDFMCSFCVIPFARGRSRPREPENIKQEVQDLERCGVKEIVLTGVNIGTYQYETMTLLDLLDILEGYKGIQRIRISSIEPTTVGPEIFQRMKGNSKLVPYLHLPLQSADDAILKKMRRRYCFEEFLAFILQAKGEVPGICVGSDVIVGFPGEDDKAFETTYQNLKAAPIDYFHVFPYAERIGTTSEKLFPKVPANEIQKRAALLRDLSNEKREQFIRQFLGESRPVLFEKNTQNTEWQGYSDNYIRVAVESESDLKNEIRQVLIKKSAKGIAFGNLKV